MHGYKEARFSESLGTADAQCLSEPDRIHFSLTKGDQRGSGEEGWGSDVCRHPHAPHGAGDGYGSHTGTRD